MTRVLVVDDEPQLLRALDVNLRVRGYDVDVALTGERALKLAASHHPDVVILDLGLPGIDGIDVIRGLRGWTDVPVIILSAREAELDKVAALDAGADDYITKPFGIDELLARLRAALRRAALTGSVDPVIDTPNFRIDLSAKQVTDASGPIRLTPIEWQILELLVHNEGRLITHRQLVQRVWGTADQSANVLRVHLANLRRKLEPDPAQPRYLRTEPGMGYCFTR